MEREVDPVVSGDGIYCNHSLRNEFKPLLIVFCSSGAVSALMCAIAIAAMVFFRFFKLLTHRLIFYTVVTICFYSLAISSQFLGLWFDYWEGEHMEACLAVGYLLEYSTWLMFLSSLMMTLHLTIMVLFATWYENLTKLEPFYLLFPWIFPLFVAWIPFLHHNYGISGSWCWIRLYNNDCSLNKEGMIEVYAVWYGDLFLGLVLNNICIAIIAITLCRRACSVNETSTAYKKALKQTMPLIAYPVTYQFLSLFAIANRLYEALNGGRDVKWMFYAHAVTAPVWGMFAPVFTLIYLLLLRKFSRDNVKTVLKQWRQCCRSKREAAPIASNHSKRKVRDADRDDTRRRLLDPSDHLTQYGVTETCPTVTNFRSETELERELYQENEEMNFN